MKKATAGENLTLSRETLRTLSEAPLAEAKGGATPAITGIILISLAFCDELFERLN